MQILLFAIALFVASSLPAVAQAPVPGPNVNMVSGTSWPGGDPYLQRQNEPSVAVSSRNPLHLLAGANDYRTVDLPGLPGDDKVVGDAWLGLFYSVDGGQTWKSTLLPGYPQDRSAAGMASPLKGLEAGADPAVRAGTNGLFYYSGIAFNRGKNGAGKVFVARLIDDNSRRSTDPIRYISTAVVDTGNAGQFVDKPWIAVDKPRAGAATCVIPGAGTIPSQTFPGGSVYMAYAIAKGNETAAGLVLSRSADCGATWSRPTKLSEGTVAGQGASIAIDPASGTVYVFWRTFPTGSHPVEILMAKSTNLGQTFTRAARVAVATPFEQGTSYISFRTSAFPTATVDTNGKIYVAWSQRPAAPEVDARIVLTSSADGGNTWSAPSPVDSAPGMRGHQIMPSLAFSRGKLVALYYDLREDHTEGKLECVSALCLNTPPGQRTTEMLSEVRHMAGDLLWAGNEGLVFNEYIADSVPPGFPPPPNALQRRHTLDVRASQLDIANNAWTHSRISQYLYGSPTGFPGSKEIRQLRYNPPNLPLFGLGTKAFIGDYVDVAGTGFSFDPQLQQWHFDAPSNTSPVFHAVWTDNRDVRPPPDGNWSNYTPPKPAGPSIFDPSQNSPACTDNLRAGMRNQNIYTSRITQGLVAGALINTKALSNQQRAFSVFVQNSTNQIRHYRLTLEAPANVTASFIPTAQPGFPFPLLNLEATVPARSSAARTVFVTSGQGVGPRIAVNVQEIAALSGPVVMGGQVGSIILNPDLTNPDLTNPDLTNPDLTNPDLTNPDLTNPDLTNPDLTNPDLTNPDLTNPDLTNPDLTNPDLTNPGIANPDLTNPDLTNPDLTNPDLTNSVITNGNIIDATWRLTNRGTTAASYSVKTLFRSAQLPPGIRVQLLLTRTYTTPVSRNCEVKQEIQNILVTNIPNPDLTNPDLTNPDLTNPDLTNPDLTNATISLLPGETGNITLRVIDLDKTSGVQLCGTIAQPCTPGDPNQLNPAEAFQPLPVAQVNDLAAPPGSSLPLVITTMTLPAAAQTVPYSHTLEAVGGSGVRTWSLSSGSLPAGLTLDGPSGVLSGTPSTNGTSTFTVQVASNGQTDHRSYTMTVGGAAIVFTAQPANGSANSIMSPVTVRVIDASGAAIPSAPVSLSLTTNPSDAGVSGTMSGFTDGTGSFTATPTIDKGGTGYVLTAYSGMLTPVESIPFTMEGLSTNIPSMTTGRHSHSAVALYNGKVLFWGGSDTVSPNATSSPKVEVYDPATNTIAVTPGGSDSGGGRINHTAVSLPQGLVLFTGGRDSAGNISREQQYVSYSPSFPTQTAIAPIMPVGAQREHHTATLLGDGRKVLIAGGTSDGSNALSTAFVFDPQAGTFLPVTMNAARRNHTATLLGDGRVLIAGGYDGAGVPLATAELFDLATGVFANIAAPMNQARAMHAAIRMTDGYVLLTGGEGVGAESPASATAEFFNPFANTFGVISPGMSASRRSHQMTMLASGKILISGGSGPGYSSTLDLFDPNVGFVGATGTLSEVRRGLAATALPDGRVLLSGGTDGAAVPGASEIYHPVGPPFAPAAFTTGPFGTARSDFTMTHMSDGRILIAGGLSAAGTPLATAYIYDALSNSFGPTFTNMNTARSHHSATLLANGKVLIVGGNGGAGAIPSAELYDPVLNTFSAAGAMDIPRARHTATLLFNGRVLIAGGQNATGFLSSAQFFDPEVGNFTASTVAMNVARAGHTATSMAGAHVMLSGGENLSGALASSEYYDYNLNGFPAAGMTMMPSFRKNHTATRLPNGNVVVIGGHNGTATLASAEVYNILTGVWSSAGSMTAANARDLHTATLLPSGKVLVFGGGNPADVAMIYDPLTASFSTTALPAGTRYRHSAVLLPNGKVYLGGGTAGGAGATLATADVYSPAP
jgi:uncharacterized protein YjbI with pentapeptide repeats